MRRARTRIAAAALLSWPMAPAAVLSLGAAGAEAQTAPRSALPGRQFEAPPAVTPDAPAAPPSGVAPPPAPPAPAPAAGGPRFVLEGVRFVFAGPPAPTQEILRDGASPLIGQAVSHADLEALRRALTGALVAEGYVNSGLLLPDQRIEDGIVTYQVVIGRLADVRMTGEGLALDGPAGLGRLDPDYVTDRLGADPEAAFDIDDLRESLRRLLRDRNIARVDAAVRPGDARGEAVLDLAVETRRPLDLAFTLDNATRAELGQVTAATSVVARNLVGVGDALAVEAQLSQGVREVVAQIDAPLWAGGPSLFLSGEHARARVVEAPLRELDITSRFDRIGVGLAAPVVATAQRDVGVSLAFDLKATRSELGGEPFSFSPGVRDGETRLSVAEFATTWIERRQDATLALRSALRAGLPVFGATDNGDDAPDALFVAWIGQAQAAARLDPRVTVLARAQVQLASEKLLPAEKVAIGGAATVRGYREGALIGDQAFAGTLEARLGVAELAVPSLTPPGHDATVNLIPFLDYGVVWDKGGRDDTRAALGVGAGLSWSPNPSITASLAVGFALRDAPDLGPEGGLQENGVHFALSFQLP